MEKMKELERRIAALERQCQKLDDIESIKKMRYKYWRCVRDGLYDELVDLFSENAAVDLGPLGLQAKGKEAVTRLYKSFVAPNSPANMNFPRGFIPEIEITGADTANAIWLGEAPRIDPIARTVTRVGFVYHEEYLKERGEWKISSLKISYTFTTEAKLVLPPSPKKD